MGIPAGYSLAPNGFYYFTDGSGPYFVDAVAETATLVGSGGGGGGSGANLSVTRNATQVVVASDTGTDATLAAADGSNAGVMTSAMQTKLAGIATGATANSADATLLDRANHTGTQTKSTISDFPADVSQAEAEAGTEVATRTWSPLRIAQAIAALETGGGGGNVATDAIFDAAGDLVQGTGANTAARLAIGTAKQVLQVNTGATAAEWGATDGDASGALLRANSPTTLSVGTNLTRATHYNRLLICDTAATHVIQDDTTAGSQNGDIIYGINISAGDVTFTNESSGTASVVTAEGDKTLIVPPGRSFLFQRTAAHTWIGGSSSLQLSGYTSLDGTTESTIETAIDTLANLTSVQGRTITLVDAGADALFGWDDSANAYQNLSAADARAAAGAAAAAGQATGVSCFIETPSNKTYVLVIKSAFAWTANEIVVRTASGTCSVQATIDGTNMTGGSVSASSTEASSSITAANAVAAGNDVAIVITSNSSAADLRVSINGTRTLA